MIGGQQGTGLWERGLGFWLDNRLIALLAVALLVGAGLYVSPFSWDRAEVSEVSAVERARAVIQQHIDQGC